MDRLIGQCRTSRTLPWAALLALCASVALVGACSGKQKPEGTEMPDEVPSTVDITPRKNVYLRAGFDADPSDYVGRFVDDDVPANEIDETKAVQTKCSKHIEYKEVRAGGTYDEVYKASKNAGASLGVSPIPQAAGASGEASAGMKKESVVRVEYKLTKKMRGVKTPDYYECCRSNVNGCSGRYLSEFWAGTGEVYQYVGSEKGFKANANVPATAKGDVEYKQGAAWKKAMTFDDLYFAFTTADAAIDSGDCGWVDNVPTSDEGEYFVGTSTPAATESKARSLAMRDARTQVVQYLGQSIKAASKTKSSAMEGYIEDEEVLQTMAQGVAERVKDKRYCPVEKRKSPEGPVYVSRVLAFFPDDAKKDAALSAVDKLEMKLEADGKLTDAEKKKLEQIRKDVDKLESGEVKSEKTDGTESDAPDSESDGSTSPDAEETE